ncbi:MAG TPA: PucR family transcriptional regulator [Solirubrobacteraceae bacterium]|nr:PucR family transcriptional regulator [Solirubrobacteraceae bacterium]
MPEREPWDPPSPRVAELIRAAAKAFLDSPGSLLDEVDKAVLAMAPERILAEPALTSAISATNRANVVHWATANFHDPGTRVPANLGPDVMDVARDIVRRGFDETSLNSYRVGQNVAWRYIMALAFALTSDPDELRELLDVIARSIFTFVDETLNGIQAQIERERDELTRGTHAERLETVNLILEGAPISVARAGERLRYELAGRHAAAVLWSQTTTPAHGELEQAAELLARAAGARRAFTVVASARSLWAWIAITGEEPDAGALAAALDGFPDVRAALGPTGAGMAGFRRSHLDALSTQRLMHRMPEKLRLATYRDVQLVALAAQDEELMSEFVARTLGDLATADEVIRDTLRAYIREQFSASATARALFAHRNTVLNRIERARELLPGPLDGHGLEVGLALEIVHWLGPELRAV